jgi:hypothetical protein
MSAGIPTNIKKFDEFKPVRKKWKMLNKLYIKGTLKGSFWKKEVDFEMVVVHTNIKNLIVDIQLLEGDISLRDDRFNIDFRIGDHIDKAKEWVSKNGHVIDADVIK